VIPTYLRRKQLHGTRIAPLLRRGYLQMLLPDDVRVGLHLPFEQDNDAAYYYPAWVAALWQRHLVGELDLKEVVEQLLQARDDLAQQSVLVVEMQLSGEWNHVREVLRGALARIHEKLQ